MGDKNMSSGDVGDIIVIKNAYHSTQLNCVETSNKKNDQKWTE